MTEITVTATVSYTYDPADGLVSNTDEALEDVREMLMRGISPNDYTYTVTGGEPDLETRPTTSCGCGFDLVWISGAWEHDVAPSIWGDDHDPHPDQELPEAEHRKHWDEIDGVGEE